MSIRFVRQIENNIKSKMKDIKDGNSTPSDSKIGLQFNKLKDLDEASYVNLLQQYKDILNG